MFFLFVNKLFNVRNKKTKKRRGLLLLKFEVLDYLYTKTRKAHDMLVGVFHLFLWCINLKVSKFQISKNKQKRFFMSLKMQVQKYKNFLIPPKDFLANFGFPLAKVAKSQRLFHVSREFTRIFWNELWLLAIGVWQK